MNVLLSPNHVEQARTFGTERLQQSAVLFNDALKLLQETKNKAGEVTGVVERDGSMPGSKSRRPGIGYKGFPGFNSMPAEIGLELLAPDLIRVKLAATEGASFGRPVAVASDFGVPRNSDREEHFTSFEMFITPNDVTTEVHAENLDGSWDRLEGLEITDARSPDAMLLARVCVDGLKAKPIQKTKAVESIGSSVLQTLVAA